MSDIFKPRGPFPLFLDDFERSTLDWAAADRYAYLRVLFHMWDQGGFRGQAMIAVLQDGLRDHRLESQLQLVWEHWTSVRRLWLGDPDLPDVGKFRSDLPPDFWIGCGVPGIAPIKPLRNGRFEFTEANQGAPAMIIPAYDTIPGMLDANPERHVEHLVDLVAVDVDRPDRFWRRRGDAVVLGAAYLEIAGQELAPVPVFSTPLSWLRSGGTGVCILDWGWIRELLLGHELIAEDIELGTRLEAALVPSILVMEAAA